MFDPRHVESDAVQQEYYKNVAMGDNIEEKIVTSFNPHLSHNKRQEISIKLPQLALEYTEEASRESYKAHIGSGQITQSLSRRSHSQQSWKSSEKDVFPGTSNPNLLGTKDFLEWIRS